MSDIEASAGESKSAAKSLPNNVYLVPYPKIIFLYPTYFMAIFSAIFLHVKLGDEPLSPDQTTAVLVNLVFLGVLAINLVVFSFDFPRTTSLTLFFLIAALVMTGVVISVTKPELLPQVLASLKMLHPLANSTFYYIFAGVMTLLYIVMFISVRFDYWEVRPNELLHHHGVLSDLKRFSAPELRIEKEINDVFEYLLLRSGRLILRPSGENRDIVLENVPFVSAKEEAVTRMLGALQVQVRRDSP